MARKSKKVFFCQRNSFFNQCFYPKTTPRKHHKYLDKLIRGLKKNCLKTWNVQKCFWAQIYWFGQFEGGTPLTKWNMLTSRSTILMFEIDVNNNFFSLLLKSRTLSVLSRIKDWKIKKLKFVPQLILRKKNQKMVGPNFYNAKGIGTKVNISPKSLKIPLISSVFFTLVLCLLFFSFLQNFN
jgi:hypothetical protein